MKSNKVDQFLFSVFLLNYIIKSVNRLIGQNINVYKKSANSLNFSTLKCLKQIFTAAGN